MFCHGIFPRKTKFPVTFDQRFPVFKLGFSRDRLAEIGDKKKCALDIRFS